MDGCYYNKKISLAGTKIEIENKMVDSGSNGGVNRYFRCRKVIDRQ